MIYLFVFNYFCFRVHYLLTSAVGLSTMGRASLPEKGGDAMQITYAELFQFCPVIIGVIGLCMQAKKK